MAKSAAGGEGDYRMTPDIDPVTGKYKVQITNRNGTAESTVHGGGGTGVANPTEFMSGTPQERQAALSQLRARAAKQYADSAKIDIAALAATTPAEIDAFVAEAKRAGKDERMAREAITNYVGHAKEYMLLNPPQDKPTPAAALHKPGAKQVTAPAFSDKEMQAASRLGVKAAPTSPNYKAVLDKAGDLIGADKNAFVKNVITQLNAGRLQQGDAIATVLKIKEDPNVAKLFSDDQIWALQVAAGKRI